MCDYWTHNQPGQTLSSLLSSPDSDSGIVRPRYRNGPAPALVSVRAGDLLFIVPTRHNKLVKNTFQLFLQIISRTLCSFVNGINEPKNTFQIDRFCINQTSRTGEVGIWRLWVETALLFTWLLCWNIWDQWWVLSVMWGKTQITKHWGVCPVR